MTNQELLEIIKIQADIIEKFGIRILGEMPGTMPERQKLKEKIELMNSKLKGSE